MKVEFSNQSISFTRLADRLQDHISSLVLTNVKLTGDDDDLYDFWKVLRGHPSLTEFLWSNVTFEDPNADVDRLMSVLFVSCPRLSRVVLDNVPVSASAIKAVEFSRTLREVSLSNDHFSDQDACIIAGVLSRNTHLEKVDFRGNDLTEEGNKAFAACLKLNKSIQDVFLEKEGDALAVRNKLHRQNSASAA